MDCATSDRLSDPRYVNAKYSIKIDHHIPVDNYGDYLSGLGYTPIQAASNLQKRIIFAQQKLI